VQQPCAAFSFAVGGAAICRLAGMHLVTYHGVRHRSSWVLVYMAMLLGAIAAVHESMTAQPSLSTLILLIGVGAYLLQSRVTWVDGPPAHTEVPSPWPLPEPFGLAAGQKQQPAEWPWRDEPKD
jgi:hypothetical protein